MEDLSQINQYEKLLKIADILNQSAEQHQAVIKLIELIQWQIVDLNKRIKVLEHRVKEQPAT